MYKIYCSGLALGLFILGSSPAKSEITLSLINDTQTAANLVIGLQISGLGEGAAPTLGGYDIDIHFDPAQLSYSSVEFGDLQGDQLNLFGLGLSVAYSSLITAGDLNLTEVSADSPADLNALQTGSFRLATINFTLLGGVDSQLRITANALSDADGLEITAASTPLAVIAAPLPATGLILGPTMLGLVWKRGQRKYVTA